MEFGEARGAADSDVPPDERTDAKYGDTKLEGEYGFFGLVVHKFRVLDSQEKLELPPEKKRAPNYRDDANKPRRAAPELLKPLEFDPKSQRVLLVDDVSVSGATFNVARELLTGASITTLVCKGKESTQGFVSKSGLVQVVCSTQQHASAQQLKSSSPIPLPLDQLQLRDLPLRLSIAPRHT
jgi:hypothetical protein